MLGNHVAFGEKRRFRCNEGFSLIGHSKVTCESSGQWSYDIPTCEAIETTTKKTKSTKPSTISPKTKPPTTSYTLPSLSTERVKTSAMYYSTKTDVDIDQTPVTTSKEFAVEVTEYASSSLVSKTITKSTESKPGGETTSNTKITTSPAKDDISDERRCQNLDDGTEACEQGTECNDQICRCEFGLNYDHINKVCRTDCIPPLVYAQTFQKYTNTTIHDDSSFENATHSISECLNMCTAIERCIAVISVELRGVSMIPNMRCRMFLAPFNLTGKRSDREGHTTFVRDCRAPPHPMHELNSQAQNDVEADYEDWHECDLGYVYSRSSTRCTLASDCDQMAETFQVFHDLKLDRFTLVVGSILQRHDLEDCLMNCRQVPDCNTILVKKVNGMFECSLLNDKDFADRTKVDDRCLIFSRDCL